MWSASWPPKMTSGSIEVSACTSSLSESVIVCGSVKASVESFDTWNVTYALAAGAFANSKLVPS